MTDEESMNHDAEVDEPTERAEQPDGASEGFPPDALAEDFVVIESPVTETPVVTQIVDDGPVIEGPTVVAPEQVGEIEEISELDQLEEVDEPSSGDMPMAETAGLYEPTTPPIAANDDEGFEDEQIASLVEELEADEASEPEAEPGGQAAEAQAEQPDDGAEPTEEQTADAPEPAQAVDEPETKESRLSRAEARVAARKEARGPAVSLWPFIVYDIVWLAFAGVVVWQLLGIPAGEAAYDAAVYPLLLFAGIALTAMGPLLIVAAWFFSRREDADSTQLFISALVKGAIATSIGVAFWWAALLVIDQMRFGTLF